MLQHAAHDAAVRSTGLTDGFLPHGVCYLWDRSLLATHITSDLLIGVSYVVISLALAYLVRQTRRELPFSAIVVAFGLFIVACGATHFIEVWTLWNPAYWTSASVKVVTALASVVTAAAMPFTVPAAIRTVREAKESEERRAQLVEATAANRAKSRFVATMSHELRTPLNAIIGYNELLNLELCGPVTDDQREKLRRMRASASHLQRLIDDVLDFERLEVAPETNRVSAVDLNVVLHGVVEDFMPMATSRNLALSFTPSTANVMVATDELRVRQIAMNLVSNALKYTERGSVDVALRADDESVALHVSDTGIGIAREHQQQIFEPFWQVDQRLTRRVGGTGLGLSITRGFVQALGGSIAVSSEPRKGTTFTVTLPRRVPAECQPA